jgi:hypothetical protein
MKINIFNQDVAEYLQKERKMDKGKCEFCGMNNQELENYKTNENTEEERIFKICHNCKISEEYENG